MTELLFLGISLLMVAACGLFVMAEFALITVNRNKVEQLADKGDAKAKRILGALSSLSTQLSSAQVGITVTNLIIGFLAEPAIAHYLRGPLTSIGLPSDSVSPVAITLGVLIATVVTMIFGELIPKNIAIARPMDASKAILNSLLLFTSVMRYPLRILNGSANVILGWFGIEAQEELASARSADELVSIVRRSAKQGTLAHETAIILEKSLTFADKSAADIMTPRVRMKAIHYESSTKEALDLAKQTGLSRFPVYRESTDDIVGTVHIKQVFQVPTGSRSDVKVKAIMKKPVLVPETIELEPLLEALRKGGLQMAIVIDEFGGTNGIVTIEDVLEELVGSVKDEHDKSTPDYRCLGNKSWSLSGLLRPDEIAEQIHIRLPEEEEVDTLAGLVVHDLEKIPKAGDSATINAVNQAGETVSVHLQIEKMEGNRVDRIRLTVEESHTDEGKDD